MHDRRLHRRELAGGALIVWASALAGCAQSAADATRDGTVAMFRGGPAHTGVYAAADSGTIGGLLWTFPTGGAVRGSPVVAGDVVFFGSADGGLYAVDRLTGERRWRFDAGDAIHSTPAVALGVVIFQDVGGRVRALDRATGEPRWEFATGPDLPLPWGNEGWDYYVSSAAVAGDLVVIGAGDGHLYALDTRTGEERWRLPTDGRIRSSPAVSDGTVYVGSGDGSVYAVDIETGRQRWRHDTEGRALDSGEFGFDRRTIQSSPAIADGTVFIGSRDGYLYAIDADTGERLWRSDYGMSWVNASPAVTDGVVWAATSDGRFVNAIDAGTGEELWRTPTGANMFSSPIIVGGSLIVGMFDGAVLALDRRTGREQWRFMAGDAVLSSATVAGDILYVGSDDGHVYAWEGLAAGRVPRKAVFWDSAFVRSTLYNGHAELRDALARAGYEILDAAGLARFMTEAVDTRRPAIVVFAMDILPAAVAPVGADTVLFRRFMDGPGRVVWLGYPPLSVTVDPGSGAPTGVDMNRAEPLIDVPHRSVTLDAFTAWTGPAGLTAGLPEWWVDRAGVDPDDVTTVFALDARGRAVAWARRYAGPPGSGFFRIWARRDPVPDPLVVMRLAESAWR